MNDRDNQSAISEICSFASTRGPEKPTTLAQYLERTPEGQDAIVDATSDSPASPQNLPQLKAFRAKGKNVLLPTGAADEVWADQILASRA